jgi:hypothetical protein
LKARSELEWRAEALGMGPVRAEEHVVVAQKLA